MRNDLTVSISCYNDDIVKVGAVLNDIPTSISIIIIHQVTTSQLKVSDDVIQRVNLTYIREKRAGLSYSRNQALFYCKTKYLIPTDADVRMDLVDWSCILSKVIQINDPNAAVFQLQCLDENGEFRRGREHSTTKRVRKLRSLGISSIELLVNADLLKNCDVKWDEDFGINGLKYNSCCETAFLANVYQAGLSVWQVPTVICSHPNDASGLIYNYESLRDRGMLLKKYYPNFYKILFALFYIRSVKRGYLSWKLYVKSVRNIIVK